MKSVDGVPSSATDDLVGTILGVEAGVVIVRLESGAIVRCRSTRRLHRVLGFLHVPLGRRVILGRAPRVGTLPVLKAVLSDSLAN